MVRSLDPHDDPAAKRRNVKARYGSAGEEMRWWRPSPFRDDTGSEEI